MHDLLLVASLRAVRAASNVARIVQATAQSITSVSKSDASPVTVADYAVQACVALSLSSSLPSAYLPLRLMAEEDVTALTTGSGRSLLAEVVRVVNAAYPPPPTSTHVRTAWSEQDVCAAVGSGGCEGGAEPHFILDPIDGTKGFVRGGQFCIGLAFSENSRPVLGVLGCPALAFPRLGDATLGSLIYATAGGGAWQEALFEGEGEGGAQRRERLSVAPASAAVDGVVCESFEAGHSDHALSARMAALLGVRRPPLQLDSMVKYGLLARGEASIYLRFPRSGYVECAWDHAAGTLILEEAGGRVTDAAGAPLLFGGRKLDRNVGVVATNGALHEEVLAAYRAATAAAPAIMTSS